MANEHLINKPCKLAKCDLVKCAFISSMIACFLRDFRCELNALNFKLVISNYAALYEFAHGHIHIISTVCCM